MIREVRIDGVLRERWDDTNRIYTAWDASGVQTTTRSYNAEDDAEAALALATANGTEIGNKIETVDLPAMAAIIAQTNAALRDDPSQEIKDMAVAIRRLGRRVQNLLDGTN